MIRNNLYSSKTNQETNQKTKQRTNPKHTIALLTAIAVITGLIVLIAGCSRDTIDISKQAKEKIEQIKQISLGDEDSSKKVYKGRGTPTPVTLLNEDGGAEAVFNPALAGDTDVVQLGVNYKVVPQKAGSELAEKIPWGRTPKVILTTLIPKTIDNKQKVFSVDFSVKPSKVFDLGNNRYAEFVIENPKEEVNIQINSKIKLFRYDLSMASKTKTPILSDEAGLKEYVKEEKYLETNSPVIKGLAGRLVGTDEVSTVHKIFDFVTETMTYDAEKAKSEMGKTLGAATAAQLKKGVCVEYADLFTALTRAKGIPAKYVGGIPTEGNNTAKGHAWAEVYFKNIGWAPFDPTWGDTKAATFERMRPLYVYLTDVRNDEVLGFSDIYGYKYWAAPVKVDFTISIDSSRAKYLSGMLASINSEKAGLDQLKKQLDASYAEIEAAKKSLDQLKVAIEQSRRELESKNVTDPNEYEALASKHNSMVTSYNDSIASYNKKVSAYESMRSSYEAKRKEVNALADRYNEMN